MSMRRQRTLGVGAVPEPSRARRDFVEFLGRAARGAERAAVERSAGGTALHGLRRPSLGAAVLVRGSGRTVAATALAGCGGAGGAGCGGAGPRERTDGGRSVERKGREKPGKRPGCGASWLRLWLCVCAALRGVRPGEAQRRSMTAATASPPPMQRVARPRFFFSSSRAWSSVVRMRAPEAPMG